MAYNVEDANNIANTLQQLYTELKTDPANLNISFEMIGKMAEVLEQLVWDNTELQEQIQTLESKINGTYE